ncbi:hypothetical protein F4806DRAFT_491943 [Annulohypoxylon nitens]|nr:hypothetical protein F4806DRAFT_491943 [Annulohypoxylon nitens]
MGGIGDDFKKQLIIGLAVGSVITVVVLTIERWFEPTLEEGNIQEAPLVPPMVHQKEFA